MSSERELKTRVLMKYLGWQGGTIHQVVQATGITANTLWDEEPAENHTGSDACAGWFAARTCGLLARQDLALRYYQNVDFWLGVAQTWKLET